ncbi:MAG: rhombotarget A [Moraxellaceae bacterium]|nr:MAG: rhombotarget A [Moraxellaceae bacterium]
MLKRTISLGLLCMASHAYSANIIVNTTDDEDGIANNKCSLREAITLINMTDTAGKIPEAGYGGCSGVEASPSIVLETGKTYLLDKQIEIKKSLTVNVLNENSADTAFNGENNAIIKAKGAHRLFNIDDNDPNIANLTVSFRQVDFKGCAADTAMICAPTGGLIFNRENLVISFARLSHGTASDSGGAIYNEGVANASQRDASAGLLTLNSVLFENNQASQGAAIFSVQPRYDINGSVFRRNKANVTASADPGTIVYVSRPGAAIDNSSSIARTGNIVNSTFYENIGRVANLLDGMLINNSTIILNTAGVFLNSETGSANFSNSIVMDNRSGDCLQSERNKTITNNLLYRSGDCGVGAAGNPNRQLAAGVALLANSGIKGESEGKCDVPTKDGLLCPFNTQKEIFNGFFRPRLLVRYNSIADSPIINRGRFASTTETITTKACESTDQRGKPRQTLVLCDIGAIELVIDPQRIGQDIKYNQVSEIDLTDNLGDGQLWPKEECDAVFKDLPNPPVNANWQDGCLQFTPGQAPKKGTFTLSADALLKYVPFKNFHGSDNFSIQLVTTTSRFSEGSNDRTLTLPGTIVQEPDNNFENKSVNTSGGSTGLLGLLGMLGLIGIRRRLQGAK